VSLLACQNCNSGTFNPNEGSNSSSACINCPEGKYNSYSGGTSLSDCIQCPIRVPVASAGSSTCSKDTQCQFSESANSNVGSLPLYLMIPSSCVGGLIYLIRSSCSSIETISFVSVVMIITLVGLDYMSDLIFIVYLLNGIHIF